MYIYHLYKEYVLTINIETMVYNFLFIVLRKREALC